MNKKTIKTIGFSLTGIIVLVGLIALVTRLMGVGGEDYSEFIRQIQTGEPPAYQVKELPSTYTPHKARPVIGATEDIPITNKDGDRFLIGLLINQYNGVYIADKDSPPPPGSFSLGPDSLWTDQDGNLTAGIKYIRVLEKDGSKTYKELPLFPVCNERTGERVLHEGRPVYQDHLWVLFRPL